jgi:arsenate reductase (glutaredoxin)
MRKVYFLSTCSTCIRIIKSLNIPDDFVFQDIKIEKITAAQIDSMKALAGSYEKLFSQRSMKYKSLGLAQKGLNESDYRQLILDEYTFLKRPVFLIDKEVFIGNDKTTVALVAEKIAGLKTL